jgi:CheY-like chemotaxis protein
VRRILAVDDTRAAAFTLAKLLEKMGQRVWTAADGDAALQIARTERPEVIISDIAMPNMDGYELARQLRQEPGFERVVLVALTGFGQESDRERAREAGFDHHLIKPVDVAALQELLAALPAPPHRTVS